jgi:hypothetical protein
MAGGPLNRTIFLKGPNLGFLICSLYLITAGSWKGLPPCIPWFAWFTNWQITASPGLDLVRDSHTSQCLFQILRPFGFMVDSVFVRGFAILAADAGKVKKKSRAQRSEVRIPVFADPKKIQPQINTDEHRWKPQCDAPRRHCACATPNPPIMGDWVAFTVLVRHAFIFVHLCQSVALPKSAWLSRGGASRGLGCAKEYSLET